MKKKFSAIIVSQNRKLYRDITARLASVIEESDRVEAISAAHSRIKDRRPDLVFFDMQNQGRDFYNLLPESEKACLEPEYFLSARKRTLT